MEPILKTVAKAYTKRYPDIKRFCFVFPNKRCGIYLKKYFGEEGLKSDQLPHIYTISEFVALIAKKTEASRIVQLFTLFNAYKDVIGVDTELDFDAFRGWGETVLSDFNTVDLNLVDPKEIFKNVNDYRAIASNFLTDEQKEVMKEYFGVESDEDPSKFWKTFNQAGNYSSLQQKFLNLWQVLAPLHDKFIEQLSGKGLGSTGSIYREAAKKIKEKGREILPYNKIIAVGFNAISESEREIFKSIQSEVGIPEFDDFADFIWDATGPVLTNNDFSASRFVNYNKKHFPAPEWLQPILDENEISEYPEIEIISAPSVTSQAKVAGMVLDNYKSSEKKKIISDAEVALILPDESLLSNVLYSLPDGIGDVNLTMGYSFRLTPISSFMALLRRVYGGWKENKKGGIFFVKDIKMFLSHPYSNIIFETEKIEALLDYVSQYHKLRLEFKEIVEYLGETCELLSFPSKNNKDTEDNKTIFEFIRRILDFLISKLSVEIENNEESEDIPQINIYKEYIDSLEAALEEFKIQSSPMSIMKMADRLLSSEKIGFEGEPLIGLQVMGTLETRSIDFKHVIIMSMNEGIMPRKAMISTFIPESLRKAYGLPPSRYAEEIFSYYFYRLISRAEKVTLIYDGRTSNGMKGGESRYLLQLRQYAPEEKIHEEAWQYGLQTLVSNNITIEKTPEIFDIISNYCITGVGSKNFSASSLNTYRECGVRFFLQNILNIDSDPEKGDYMDAIAIGDVLHDVMMKLYVPVDKQKKLLKDPISLTKERLEDILDSTDQIRDLVEKSIREIYYGDKKGEKDISSGVTEIIRDQIVELIKEIIRHDITLAPFHLYGCEISEILRVKLLSGKIVNFRFAIDRLDEIEYNGQKRLRIVDYKTGARKRTAKSLEEVFQGGYRSEQIFQLFLYAWLLGKKGVNGSDDVMTEIYFVPDFIKGEKGLPEINKAKVESFAPYKEEFNKRLEDLLESIFNDSEFTACKNPRSCSNCSFRNFCGR